MMTTMNERRLPRRTAPRPTQRVTRRVAVYAGALAAAVALSCSAQLAGPTPSPTLAQPSQPPATAPPSQPTPATPTTFLVSLAARLQTLYPATHFGAVNATAWPGVYEVVMGANIAYVDDTGQFFLFGHLYDMKIQRDVTAEHKDTFARIDFASLPLADALKEVRGNGARVLAIFSDPECPYCRRLESDLRRLTDVTIYTFLMPIAALHPTAHDKAVTVWCAKDRIAAWHATMARDEALVHADCPHPVDRNVALGERLGIIGTPTLVAVDGRVLPGAASKEQIEAWLVRPTVSAHDGAELEAGPR